MFVLNTTAFAQTVEEVTVTATRKSESLQDIALSVQSLEDELLESTHIETSRDLAILVPGLTFASGTGSGSATRMRGLIMPAVTSASVDANQTMINGHTLPNTTFGEMGFFDAERLEILNGPQGTLYGRNAVTGIINLISKRPGAGNYVQLSGGEYGYNLLKAGIDIPLTEKLSGRLAVNRLNHNGTISNTRLGSNVDGRNNASVRLSLDYQFDDGSLFLFNIDDISINDNRLNLGTTSCNRDAFFGCASANTDIRDHLNRPLASSGGIAAVLQKIVMIRTNISDDNFATSDTTRVNDIDVVSKDFDSYRKQDDVFRQAQYITNFGSPLGDVEVRFKVSDRDRFFLMTDDNDHSSHTTPINNYYTSATFNDVNGVNMLAGSDGIYNIENLPTYCRGNLTIQYNSASECSLVFSDEQQYEINFISDFDGPFNFVTGFYSYNNEIKNQYAVNSTELAMAQDFALNPVSKIFNGGQDTKGGFVHAAIVEAVLNSSTAQAGAAGAVAQSGNSSAAVMLATVQGALAPTLNGLVNGLCTRDSAGEALITSTGAANSSYGATGTITGIDVCTKKLPIEMGGNMIDSRTDRDSMAVYGELYYDITDSTQLIFGARYMDDRYTNTVLSSLMDTSYAPTTANATNPSAIAACNSATGYEDCFGFAAESTGSKEEVGTYKLALKHQYETDLTEGMFFVSYTEGNRPGGANAQTLSKYPNSETESIQIGTRNTFLGGALQLNVTAFNDKQFDAQTSEIYVTGSNVLPLDMTHQGIEIQSSFFITESTVLTFNGLFTDSEIEASTGANVVGPLGNIIASGSNLLDPHNPTNATSFGTAMSQAAFGQALVAVYGFDAAMAGGVALSAATSATTVGNVFNGIIPTAIGTAQAVLAGAGFPDVTADMLYIVDNNGNILVNPLGLVLDVGMKIETGGSVTYGTQNLHSSGATIAAVLNNVCAGARAVSTTTATCAAASSSASVMQSVAGNKIPGVSDYEYTIGLTHFFEGFGGSGSVSITYADNDGGYLDVWNNDRYVLSGFDDISANILFTPTDGEFIYNLWVRNLENKREINSVNRSSNLQGAPSFVTFTEGRKIGFDIRREF